MIDLAALRYADDLPFVSATPSAPIEGAVRSSPEDFRVQEIPAYLPCGHGDHLFVQIQKRDLTTKEAVRRVARALDLHPRSAGFAGMKDRVAVTDQWVSFEHGDASRLEREIEGVQILRVSRHTNKLRTGHLRGNRFEIFLRGAASASLDASRAVLGALALSGVPAYFGPQRFGREGDNLSQAADWLFGSARAPRDRFRRKLLASAFQSALFNHLLAARITDGLLDRAIHGDLMQRVESGGLFECERPEEDTERARSFEITATGPMFGPKMRWTQHSAADRERAVLDLLGLDRDRIGALGKAGPGTRRPYRFAIRESSVVAEREGLRIRFELPAGAYATVVLRELLRRPVR